VDNQIEVSQDLKLDSLLLNDPFTISELNRILLNLNFKSTPGCHDIPLLFFKYSPQNVIEYILSIVNLSWNLNDIPPLWKTSIIKPILKQNKDVNDFKSYRPISLTNTISKIVEKLITARLTWYLGKNNLLNPDQAGFRKSFSTSDPIIRLSHEANLAVNSGNFTVAVMIDFSCAFDLLWVDGLLIKMMALQISGKMLKWIKNFLSNRINRVKVGENYSNDFHPDNGTPQGSSLSPILFIIMVNDSGSKSVHSRCFLCR